jgi:hypothetical protein
VFIGPGLYLDPWVAQGCHPGQCAGVIDKQGHGLTASGQLRG